jgi:hypothetical protein
MKSAQIRNVAAGAVLTLGLMALATRLSTSPSVHAQAKAQDNEIWLQESRIQIGFEIAPVPLNLAGKDRDLVGLGSYLVNAVASCNDCHTAGGPPNYNYAAGANPYFGEHKKTDPTTYLAGGTDFGPALPPGVLCAGLWKLYRSRHCLAQLDARQNGAACRGSYAGAIHADNTNRR